MSPYVWGMKAAVRNAFLPCPKCKAPAGWPCLTAWQLLLLPGLVSHAERAVAIEEVLK